MKSPLLTTALGRFRSMAIICGINLILLVIYMVLDPVFVGDNACHGVCMC
jgi:hypothetical protein